MASFPDVPDVLARPFIQAVLRTHPNTHAVHPELPLHASALSILRAYLAGGPPPSSDGLPPPLAACVAAVRHHQLPRTPIPLLAPPLPTAHAQGMSPKKAHEVTRMAAYVVALVRASSFPEDSLHIVDVGAGQGYLTRALKARLPWAHILALDADEAQTAGAQKWERRVLQGVEPPIAHRTVLIGEGTLLRAVDEWIEDEGIRKETEEENGARAPVPVLFVALHACGSLTPDVLRAFTAARKRTSPTSAWYPAAAVAVGCCYNLMHPSDFPLSTPYRTHATPPSLPPAAFHLAAQIPSTWVVDSVPSSEASRHGTSQSLKLHPSAALAIRKVVWRALLECALQNAVPSPLTTFDPSNPGSSEHLPASEPKNKSATVPAHWPRRPEQWAPSTNALQDDPTDPTPTTDPTAIDSTNTHLASSSGIGMTPALRRLGRLRDAAYADSWSTFLLLAAERMGVVLPEEGIEDSAEADDSAAGDDDHDGDQAILGALPHALRPQARELAALHVLRCVVGVLVESAVLRDRAAWVEEELGLVNEWCGSDEPMKVALVNLFDQATGSGRNVAIVLAPMLPPLAEE